MNQEKNNSSGFKLLLICRVIGIVDFLAVVLTDIIGIISIGMAIFWIVLAPISLFVSTNINGTYERFISLITLAWVAAISWLLIRKSQEKLSEKIA